MAQNSNTSAAGQAAVQNEDAASQAASIVQVVVNAANNDAAIAEVIPFQSFLHTIFSLTRT